MRPRIPESRWARVDRLKRQRLERDLREYQIEVEIRDAHIRRVRDALLAAAVPLRHAITPPSTGVFHGVIMSWDDHASPCYRVHWVPAR